MPKKVSEKEKAEMTSSFLNGQSIEELSEKYNCTKITISRNLKKIIGDNKFKDITKANKQKKELVFNEKLIASSTSSKVIDEDKSKEENLYSDSEFIEIIPLDCEIDNSHQKDLSSVPILDVDFPKVVYMIVDKKIELETKYLSEYPEWGFLSQQELKRKTIEIFFDLKIAKRFCKNEKKVIKIPNPDVFRIAANKLLDKGISRIVSPDKLISL